MDVERRWFADFRQQEIEEIRRRQELVVVVDLWAATTNIVLMLGKKPARLIIINDDKYKAAKNLYKDSLLIGQSYQIPKEEFAAATNLPFDIQQVNIRDKLVLYTSFNGARVLEAFSMPEPGLVLICAFSNCRAVANYLEKTDVPKVTIVASGNLTGEMGGLRFFEDWIGAEILEKTLKREQYDEAELLEGIKKVIASQYPDRPKSFLEEEVWPFIFAPKSDILPTAFVNSDGFVEVVNFGDRSGS